jgi:hypothetical protein
MSLLGGGERGLADLSDRELRLRRDQLAVDARTDPERRDELLEVEEESARRARAEKGGSMAPTIDTEGLRELSDAELDRRRTALHALSASEADAAGRQAILAEIRDARVRDAAELEVPDAERRLRAASAAWEGELERLRGLTVELRQAIAVRSEVRSRAYGDPPRWGTDQERAFSRACAVVAHALGRPAMADDPMRYLERGLTELL